MVIGVHSYSISWTEITWWSPSLSLSATSFNSEFSFWTNCHAKVKELSLPYNLPMVGENSWIYTFPKYYVKYKQYCSGFELGYPSSFPTTITSVFINKLLCLILKLRWTDFISNSKLSKRTNQILIEIERRKW